MTGAGCNHRDRGQGGRCRFDVLLADLGQRLPDLLRGGGRHQAVHAVGAPRVVGDRAVGSELSGLVAQQLYRSLTGDAVRLARALAGQFDGLLEVRVQLGPCDPIAVQQFVLLHLRRCRCGPGLQLGQGLLRLLQNRLAHLPGQFQLQCPVAFCRFASVLADPLHGLFGLLAAIEAIVRTGHRIGLGAGCFHRSRHADEILCPLRGGVFQI